MGHTHQQAFAFIEEFEEELSHHKIGSKNPRILLKNQGFHPDAHDNVRLYVELEIDGINYELMFDDVTFFVPGEANDISIYRMGELYGMSEEEARARLRKVERP